MTSVNQNNVSLKDMDKAPADAISAAVITNYSRVA